MHFCVLKKFQDGHQQWQEKDFWEKLANDSVFTLWAKNFGEIALSHTVSEISKIFYFHH